MSSTELFVWHRCQPAIDSDLEQLNKRDLVISKIIFSIH